MQTAITVALFVAALLCLGAAFGLVQIGAGIEAGFFLLSGVYLAAKGAERL